MSYSGIKKAVKMNRAAQVNRYKNGGAVKKSGTTVNIVVSPARGDAPSSAPIAPAGPSPAPSRGPGPSAPIPPIAAQAGLGAMGASPPPFARGGRVAMKAGAASGEGRLEKKDKYGAKPKGK